MATIELLAEKLGKQVWIKGDLKRIYLNDAGYNTKKMSTRTFIWADETGEFKVSCRIDCPSQGFQWIKSQEEEVKQSIHEQIEQALATEVFAIIEKDSTPKLNEIGYSDVFYSRNSAEIRMKKDWFGAGEIKVYDRIEFETEVERLDEIERQQREAEKAINPVQPTTTQSTPIKNTETPTYGIDSQVKHKLFGIGTVMAESDDKIEISFEVGVKALLKKFASLEKL